MVQPPVPGGNIALAPDGLGQIDLQKPLINNGTNNNNIYDSRGAPLKLIVTLAVLATSSGQIALTHQIKQPGPLISASTSGIAKFTVDSAGNLTAAGNGLFPEI